MNTTILITFITSCSSILIAIIAWRNSRSTEKNTANANLQLERLKADLETKKLSDSTHRIAISVKIQAFKDIIRSIQHLKDILLHILNSREKTLSSAVAKESLNTAIEDLVMTYEKVCSHLTQDESKPGHDAKNIGINLKYGFLEVFQDEYVQLNKVQRLEFQDIKVNLSDQQNLLRDNISELMFI
jgi:hypothetical protein